MPNFTYYSNFDPNAAIESVKYASNALVLEVELNEAQNILDNKIKTLIKDRFGDGFYKTGSTLTYSGGNVTLSNDKAFASGDIVTISSLTLALATGESAYLDVWEQELNYTNTIKKYGNQQEANTITNYIQDARTGEETTRRTQVQYNIVKTTGVSGHTYLPLCSIVSGSLVDNRVIVGSLGSGGSGSTKKLYSSFTATLAGTTNCLINQPDYNPTTDYLDVFYQGGKQTPGTHYTLNANNISIDLAFSIGVGEVINFEVVKNIAVSTSSGIVISSYRNSVTTSGAQSTVTIGIPQFNPTTDLLTVAANTTLPLQSDFTVTGTGSSSAIVKASGTWASGTQFDFLVIKNVIQSATVDGSILVAGTVPVSALNDELQSRLEVSISTYRSAKDSNGKFTQIDKKRSNGTLFSRSILSGGTSPLYTSRTETLYATNGSTVTGTKIYTLSYDSDGDMISEVLN
jgi:hypothetical protein